MTTLNIPTKALKALMLVASKDKIRHAISSVHISAPDKSTVILTATDGKVLARVLSGTVRAFVEPVNFAVPLEVLKIATATHKEFVEFEFGEKICVQNGIIVFQILPTIAYPEVANVIPTSGIRPHSENVSIYNQKLFAKFLKTLGKKEPTGFAVFKSESETPGLLLLPVSFGEYELPDVVMVAMPLTGKWLEKITVPEFAKQKTRP